MGQQTAKSVEHALGWIEEHQHHVATTEEEQGYLILKGYGNKLRISRAMRAEIGDLMVPSPYAHDDRMFRASPEGRKRIGLPVDQLAEAEALIRELIAHEGAEAHSTYLEERLAAYQFQTKEQVT